MQKLLPLAIATTAVIAVQIGCTYALLRSESADVIFVDHVRHLAYDGQVIRADFANARIADSAPDTDIEIVARLALTKDATVQLHRQLAELLSFIRSPPEPKSL